MFLPRLNSSDKDGEPLFIQMVTALVLQLIQCVVHLPNDKDALDEYDSKVGAPRPFVDTLTASY